MQSKNSKVRITSSFIFNYQSYWGYKLVQLGKIKTTVITNSVIKVITVVIGCNYFL